VATKIYGFAGANTHGWLTEKPVNGALDTLKLNCFCVCRGFIKNNSVCNEELSLPLQPMGMFPSLYLIIKYEAFPSFGPSKTFPPG
jgi:hypothetical protein